MSSKDGYVKTPISFINHLFKFKIFIVLSNWTFQGMLYTDKTERSFRLLLDVVMMLTFYLIFIKLTSNVYIVLIFSFLVAHTFNWIFNGQLFVLGRYLGFKPHKDAEFPTYITKLKEKVEKTTYIQCVFICGSIVRGKLNNNSDLDVRILRKDGVINGLLACSFGLFERTNALFNLFPLDLYIIDSTNHINKISHDECLNIIYGSLDSNDIKEDISIE